jgi:hypothetical protein
MYTEPWIALNKLPFKLQSWHFDVTEMLCSPAEPFRSQGKHSRLKREQSYFSDQQRVAPCRTRILLPIGNDVITDIFVIGGHLGW